MPQPQQSGDDRNDGSQRTERKKTTGRGDADQQAEPRRRTDDEDTSSWLAKTGMMAGLIAIGFVLLLFALGQAVGFDLLGLFADAVSSQTGRWLVVAFFALLLIGVAERGLRGSLRHV
ncbi:hypothetical protein BG842_08145 [Haladaptatus sp. W1]|uniref:hypothetical protein n=1 Tax=unclassified Haladaptatus TaxID=2622732 RepID=UPI00084993EF|nr:MULTISPECIES: hypothetical protein [unclassified Haladaptatus]ODR79098.1 hypothetical protein BG842_08145 [Haladaptatus sp. W1]GKZ13515.1 hypothetical protein HAL_13960 [Haladaptatus sp. T7]